MARTGGDILIEALIEWGVDTVFLIGAALLGLTALPIVARLKSRVVRPRPSSLVPRPSLA